MKNKRISLFMALVMMATLVFPFTSHAATNDALLVDIVQVSGVDEEVEEAPRLQDDFFNSVNHEWINENQLSENEEVINPMSGLEDNIKEILQRDMKRMINSPSTASPLLAQPLAFYKMLEDVEGRNEEADEAIKKYFAEIDEIKSISDLNSKLAQFLLKDQTVSVNLKYTADLKDSSKKLLYVSAPLPTLQNKTSYEGEIGEEDVATLKENLNSFFTAIGHTEEEAEKIADDTIEFDLKLIEFDNDDEAPKTFEGSYKPISFKEFDNSVKALDFTALIKELTGVIPEQVNVLSPEYFASYSEIYIEDNLDMIKNWMKAQLSSMSMNYISPDLFEEEEEDDEEAEDPFDVNYFITTMFFGDAIGQYYGETYFGAEAKKEVEDMVNELIEVYRDRVKANSWLSDETKANAELKLDNLIVNIGYPDKFVDPYDGYKIVTFEEGGSIIDNVKELKNRELTKYWAEFKDPVDRAKWVTNATTVNAFAQPSTNSITFAAGILQPPIYDKNKSDSENYATVGAIIAHEISHVFDNQGAKYDEFGNIKNWWTDEDFKKFEDLSQKMVEQFDGLPYGEGELDGELTLGENIADLGGVAAALEATKRLSNPDLDAFFRAWADNWKEISNDEFKENAIYDVHSPNIFRVNVILPNFAEFHETYGIVEGDEMFRPESERISIW